MVSWVEIDDFAQDLDRMADNLFTAEAPGYDYLIEKHRIKDGKALKSLIERILKEGVALLEE